MTIVPMPDRDSRFPDRYCTTCGKGFSGYLDCERDSVAIGSISGVSSKGPCNMNGIVPPDAPNPDWNKPLPGQGVGSLFAEQTCPNAPMNATINEGWTSDIKVLTEAIGGHIGIDWGAEPAKSTGNYYGEAAKGEATGWITEPIESKSQT